MDYNDNDYEGQNLHLAGEESSKISSVLRPFALPKFDFDDSLHGHLRFDSLVENEVFLGIPSQEDNQWIEDFSRGGNGIEFSSSAAESCALPRHINVWSEATSSESVEMLLKAVGQEEMVPGENMIEESDPGDQLGSSTRQMENDSRQDDKIDDAGHGNPSLSPAEVEGDSSRSNQNAGVEGDQTEYTLQVQETNFAYGVCVGAKDSSLTVTTENLGIDMKSTSANQEETCAVMNESLPNQVLENLPVPGTEIESTESSSQKISVSVMNDQDRISNISFASSGCITKGLSDSADEQEEGCNIDDDRLNGVAVVETDNTMRQCSHELPSIIESSKEEHAVEILIGESSSMPGKGESVSEDDVVCNEVAFVAEPADGGQQGSEAFSSGIEIKQLSGDHSTLFETPSVSLQGEANEGLGIEGSTVVTPAIYGNTELEEVPVVQQSDEHKGLADNKDICTGSNSSLEAPHGTSEPSMLHEVLDDHSEMDGESSINQAGFPSNLTGSAFASEFCGDKSVIDDMSDAGDTAVVQKENVKIGDHVATTSIDGRTQKFTEESIPIQVDAHVNDLDASACEKEDPLKLSDMVCDEIEKEVGSTSPGEGDKVEKSTGSQPNSSAVAYPVLDTEGEDTKLTSSYVEGDELVGCHEHDPCSCDSGHRDQSKETETETPIQPCSSVPKEPSESTELSPAIEIETRELHSAAGETKTSHQSISLVETSDVAMANEAGEELNEKMEHSVNDLIRQDDVAEAVPTEKPMEAETERNGGMSSLTVSVMSCTAETDKSDKPADPGASCTDVSQTETKKQTSPNRNNVEDTGEVMPTTEVSGVNAPSKEEGTFTFDIRPLEDQSTGDPGKGLQSFPRIQACKLSLTGEGSPSTSGSSQTDPRIMKEISHVSSLTPGVCSPSGSLGGPSQRKTRRGSTKPGKGNARKGNQVKETTPLKQTEKGDKSSQFLSPPGAGQLVTFESVVKPRGTVSIPTSSLPDLNTSAPLSGFFQQPFTDLQQVQLRAQIFVYGSLIQGAAPDEACMVSAFDGGRSIWEPSWRACVERFHGQKSQGNNTETPVPSRSDAGAKAPDQTNRQAFPQSEVLSSIAGRASNKPIPSPVVNPVIPLSSPLWSISTPSGEALPTSSVGRTAVFDYQAVSPLNPYQTPPIRNYMPHSTWPSQAPFPVPWLASSQSSPFDISSNYPTFPITEPVKLTPVKESLLPLTSGTKHVSPIPSTHTGATTMFAGASSLDLKKGKVSAAPTADTKTRKRKKSSGVDDVLQISVTASPVDTVSAPVVANQMSKKAPAVENLGQISLMSRNQADSMSKPVVSSHYSTSVAVTTPSSFVPKGATNPFLSMVSPSISSDHPKRGDLSMDKRALNVDGFSKVEEAKLQAQEAAAHAAAAISQCEGVWSQLDQQKNSGLTLDAESKLASAAAAVAAAASVAKAAAAAAKVALSAAVQAKQMADEAVSKSGTVNTTDYDASSVSNSMNNLANASAVSILKGGDRSNAPSLAISAAREAARKRVEAASAATKHAENLDAIVKAAELAAEAVSHAGKIVAMGDPFSLGELAEAGPSNYWKVLQVATVPGSQPDHMNKNKSIHSNAGEVHNALNQHKGPDKGMHLTGHVVSPIQREVSRNMLADNVTVEGNLIDSVKHGESASTLHKDKKVSDSAKSAGVVSDPDIESRSNSFTITSIKEGSLVEVLKDRGDLKKAWFSANVLSLKDGEALVCYRELQSDEGSEKLKEWISVEPEDGNAPKIRIPHPMTAGQFEGTRKRRRAAVKDYSWSVGDKVDAYVEDSWYEGIVAEKNDKDPTTLSVHFPAKGETSLVKVWHLRPTLIWSDGQWVEWCRLGEDCTSQGDTPVEKRAKLGSTNIEIKAKGKMGKTIDFVETGINEEIRLPLAANEKVFSIGSTKEENKPNTVKTMRSDRKEGSRVVFGVPKPGKKRKFMEVSKHYVSDRNPKINAPNDSAKLAKFLPQGSGARGFKSNSKVDLKEKQVPESKPRSLKSGKLPSIPSRTLAQKDDLTSSRPNARDASVSDHVAKGSISNDENESGEQNVAEYVSVSNVEEISGGSVVFSSQALPPENRKKAATRNAKSELPNQGKLAPASGKLAKIEANDKLNSEVAEPRRSNRRIQPTSRLLEGLQSSLIISKIPSSHDKSHRSQNKGTARGNK
ncbi:uncharacterized protein LOC105164342 isoform X3 [Sesamum indicum]|uniref:Uncharacterized protein LOC105164342 isoform X3 n=1 Tax=Sesamum indicum TaxID=4182 RepID=A0A6I9TK72_SESIN|nr:uncharacterized protein LOC105164342 isoform X3 [Sesamum indicum]